MASSCPGKRPAHRDGTKDRRCAGRRWWASGVVRFRCLVTSSAWCESGRRGSTIGPRYGRQAYGRSNGRRRTAGIALGALIRRGNHGPQPRVESHAGAAGETRQDHAKPDELDRPAQVICQPTADAGNHAVAAANQHGALYSGSHVPIQTRIRVTRTGNQRSSGVPQGSFRVSPSRGKDGRGGRIEV